MILKRKNLANLSILIEFPRIWVAFSQKHFTNTFLLFFRQNFLIIFLLTTHRNRTWGVTPMYGRTHYLTLAPFLSTYKHKNTTYFKKYDNFLFTLKIVSWHAQATLPTLSKLLFISHYTIAYMKIYLLELCSLGSEAQNCVKTIDILDLDYML